MTARTTGWMLEALETIYRMPLGFEGIGEDFRHHVSIMVGKPPTSYHWGPLIKAATRRGYIKLTGKLRAMKDRKSHARKSFVYRRTK